MSGLIELTNTCIKYSNLMTKCPLVTPFPVFLTCPASYKMKHLAGLTDFLKSDLLLYCLFFRIVDLS